MKPDTLYELRKDITMPGRYYGAGIQKTGSEWLELFPNLPVFGGAGEWFIDLTEHVVPAVDPICSLVNDIFEKAGLRSTTYKEAAVACVRAWQEKLLGWRR